MSVIRYPTLFAEKLKQEIARLKLRVDILEGALSIAIGELEGWITYNHDDFNEEDIETFISILNKLREIRKGKDNE